MRGLKICLWITGIVCLSSVGGVFMPSTAWECFMGHFGLGPVPDSPLFFYFARLMCAAFVGVGIYFIILALKPMKYEVLVPFSGLAAIVLGVVCAITGFAVKMPNLWFLGDALSCLVLGVLILIFYQQAKN